ncbi:MAG: alpha/beta hydrolase [Ideonella sp.]|nr:alpha/beta hydrolase [Ideonella sp.]
MPAPTLGDTPAGPHLRPPARPLSAPGPLLLLLEGRAPWEWAAMLAATPFLRRLPRGDGHPVIVYPGLGANDLSTAPLRRFLRDRGYHPHAWKQGFNFGPRHGVLHQAREQLRQVHDRHGQQVSLIGLSLGGIYARELAKEMPDLVRSVITLGTPFGGHPKATNAWRFYELVSGHSPHQDPALIEQIRQAPPVPTTSVYSRTDGVVAWRCSVDHPGPMTENIGLQASHVGMGMNPLALYVVADRLAQPAGEWQPFRASGLRKWFFRTGAAPH